MVADFFVLIYLIIFSLDSFFIGMMIIYYYYYYYY
jgi:hypothetical protein